MWVSREKEGSYGASLIMWMMFIILAVYRSDGGVAFRTSYDFRSIHLQQILLLGNGAGDRWYVC